MKREAGAAAAAEAGAGLDHLPALDGLRGLAVLLVVPHNLRIAAEPTDLWTKLLAAVLDRGWIGVQIFFVLSGFLITRILLRTRPASNYYSGFYARRGLRILPLYYATLLVMLVLLPLAGVPLKQDSSLNVYLWTFLSNYVQAFHPGGVVVPHFWSLAVEEQFYLLWPFLVRYASTRQVLGLCALVAALGLGTRCLLIHLGMPEAAVYEWTPCRMDALALGGAVAALCEMGMAPGWFSRNRHAPWLLMLALFGLGAVASKGYAQFGLLPETLGYTLLALGCAALVWGLVLSGRGAAASWLAWLRWPALRSVGRYSYGMYVLHVPLGTLLLIPLAEGLGWHVHAGLGIQLAYVVAGMVLSYVLAALVYNGFEKRFLALKHRFEPRLN